MAEPISRDDLAVTLAVRNDLTPVHDEAVIGEFLERVGAQIDARVDERVAAVRLPVSRSVDTGSVATSLVFGIPITAIVMGNTEGANSLIGLAIAWGGIALVNLANVRRR